ELRAFRWNSKKREWDDAGVIHKNAINNFAPKKISTGEWMMSRRTYNYKTEPIEFLVGGVKSLTDWKSFPVLGSTDALTAEEPYWCVVTNNKLVALSRDNRKRELLYRCFSSGKRRTWSKPVRTSFPDARSKFSGVRLKDGRYVLVSNAHPEKR